VNEASRLLSDGHLEALAAAASMFDWPLPRERDEAVCHGWALRAVEQCAALERRLYELPSLRQAMVERRLSYEKARLIARYADERSVESWIERAERMPCIDLRRQLQGDEEAQMSARGEFDVWIVFHRRRSGSARPGSRLTAALEGAPAAR